MTLDKGVGVSFRSGELGKTSRPGHHAEEMVFLAYPYDINVCLVNALEHYLDRTESGRVGIKFILITQYSWETLYSCCW